MPTYEYECQKCGFRFERLQTMKEAPIGECPECGGQVQRLITGGSGFVFSGFGQRGVGNRSETCSLEQVGKTCCGRNERCSAPPCEGER